MSLEWHEMKHNLVGGIPTPLKNMSSSVGMMKFPIYGKIKNVPKVSWDDDIPNIWKVIKVMFQTTNQ